MSARIIDLDRLVVQARVVNRIWLVILGLFVALTILAPSQAAASARFVAESLVATGPYLLLSAAVAAYARASGADALAARAFAGRTSAMIVIAALIGGLSPFCSCGVIPLIAALLSMGVPLAPVMAFWLASPVIDPAQFVLTVGVLGADFAVAKTVAAIGLGLFGGFGTMWLAHMGFLTDPLRPGVGDGGCQASAGRAGQRPIWAFWREPARTERFRHEAIRTLSFLMRWLTLAFLLESMMLAWLPAEAVAGVVGGEGVGPIVMATLIGVPAYLNGFAALPVVGGLLEQGMAPGAALAFLVAGAVSSVPAAIAVYALVKRPVFLLYLAFALVGSLAAGLAFQTLA